MYKYKGCEDLNDFKNFEVKQLGGKVSLVEESNKATETHLHL